jgi:hypothetical protein
MGLVRSRAATSLLMASLFLAATASSAEARPLQLEQIIEAWTTSPPGIITPGTHLFLGIATSNGRRALSALVYLAIRNDGEEIDADSEQVHDAYPDGPNPLPEVAAVILGQATTADIPNALYRQIQNAADFASAPVSYADGSWVIPGGMELRAVGPYWVGVDPSGALPPIIFTEAIEPGL